MASATLPQRKRRKPAREFDFGRAAYRRIIWIHERLGNNRRVTAITLARELGVSDRTIKRDIEHMRTHCGAAIAWDSSTHTYFYERPCDILPLLRLTADEALALVLASETFAAWRGSPLGRALTVALEKLADVIGGAVSLPASEVRALVFRPEEGPEADAERRWLAVALEAIRRQRELRIAYQKPTATKPEERTVHPLHLSLLEHRWMLVAHDPARRGRRNFLLARISDAKATGRTFDPPAGFDAKKYFKGSLGRFTGDGEHLVRVAFDATVAPYIRERQWHPSQTLADRPDGSVEVMLRLNNLIDVRRWVLACGSHAEVIEPAELRDAVHREAIAVATLYNGGP